jgi:hypothetical protein
MTLTAGLTGARALFTRILVQPDVIELKATFQVASILKGYTQSGSFSKKDKDFII